jgi:hydroxypyruvate isomerase
VPKEHGLVCAIADGPGNIVDGWNRRNLHDQLVAESERLIPLIAAAGIPQMIVFSGNRRGLSDGEGIANCIAGLKRIMPAAERHGVTVVMEMLNSKVDHRTITPTAPNGPRRWRAACAPSASSCSTTSITCRSWKGTWCAPSTSYAPLINHYHTAGVPGRHELDDTQELNYGRIARAIADTGFTGVRGARVHPDQGPDGEAGGGAGDLRGLAAGGRLRGRGLDSRAPARTSSACVVRDSSSSCSSASRS